MADTFGVAQNGRVQLGGRFYAVPATDVETNVIYMPKYSESPFFGITERPVSANKLGAFATEGAERRAGGLLQADVGDDRNAERNGDERVGADRVRSERAWRQR